MGGLASRGLGERYRLYAGLKVNPMIVPESFDQHGLVCILDEEPPCSADLWGLYILSPVGATSELNRLKFGLEFSPSLFWGSDGEYGLTTRLGTGLQAYGTFAF